MSPQNIPCAPLPSISFLPEEKRIFFFVLPKISFAVIELQMNGITEHALFYVFSSSL